MKPTNSAPNIEPGNAKTVPKPITFLIVEVANACSRAHIGPKSTPVIAFTRCCAGKHFVGPIGKKRGDRITAIAVNTAVAANLLVFTSTISVHLLNEHTASDYKQLI